jgi:hypothetical protein
MGIVGVEYLVIAAAMQSLKPLRDNAVVFYISPLYDT